MPTIRECFSYFSVLALVIGFTAVGTLYFTTDLMEYMGVVFSWVDTAILGVASFIMLGSRMLFYSWDVAKRFMFLSVSAVSTLLAYTAQILVIAVNAYLGRHTLSISMALVTILFTVLCSRIYTLVKKES